MNTDEARAALKSLDSVLENVRLSCVYALNDLERMEKTDKGFDDEDLIRARERASFAREILEDLGYKVDHWFCGHAVLKAVE